VPRLGSQGGKAVESTQPCARVPAAMPAAEGAVASTGLDVERALLSEVLSSKQRQPGMLWLRIGALG